MSEQLAVVVRPGLWLVAHRVERCEGMVLRFETRDGIDDGPVIGRALMSPSQMRELLETAHGLTPWEAREVMHKVGRAWLGLGFSKFESLIDPGRETEV